MKEIEKFDIPKTNDSKIIISAYFFSKITVQLTFLFCTV